MASGNSRWSASSSSWWNLFSLRRLPEVSDLGIVFGKISWLYGFQKWKDNFKTETCSKSAYAHLTMHWIKEVQIAKSIHDPVTSRSVAVRCNFSDYDVLSMITSALKKLLTHVQFTQRVSVEEQFAQQIRPILVREANLHTWSMNTFQPPELMEPYKVYKINSIDAYRMMTFKITIQGGTKQWKPQVKHQRKWSWRVSASQNYLNQFSFRLYLLCRTYSKQRTARGAVTKNQKKKKSICQRRKDNGRMLSVAINWTMFEMRLMQFPLRSRIWKQMRGETRRTIVVSCTDSEGTDWRKDTIQKFKQQKRGRFQNKRPNSVPKFFEKKYVSVM